MIFVFLLCLFGFVSLFSTFSANEASSLGFLSQWIEFQKEKLKVQMQEREKKGRTKRKETIQKTKRKDTKK